MCKPIGQLRSKCCIAHFLPYNHDFVWYDGHIGILNTLNWNEKKKQKKNP